MVGLAVAVILSTKGFKLSGKAVRSIMRTPDGIEILGKSNKANQQTVIYEVLKVFGRKK
ncbi:hypothetical protein BML2537_26140 [Providencia stuartii]|nr:hypothetical protein BML2537_26140 [Providencia stuartii]